MRICDLQMYIEGLDEDSEFAVSVRAIETGKVFGTSYAIDVDFNEYHELVLGIDVELCLGCKFLQKYDWRKNDAARCVISSPYSILSFGSMRKRRSTVKTVVVLLDAIRNAQLRALENTPRNLRDTENFVSGEDFADAIEQAVDILADIF